MTKRYLFAATIAALMAVGAPAKEWAVTDRFTADVTMYLGGTLLIDNGAGDVEIIGTAKPNVVVTAQRTVRGVDDAAVAEGRRQAQIMIGGDDRMRTIKALRSISDRWSSSATLTIRLPQTAHVKLMSQSANVIRISDMRGSVGVSNFNGRVILDRLTGRCIVDTANGDIVFNAPDDDMADTQLISINGRIEVRAPARASFQWEGETLKGDVRTTFPVRLSLAGNAFRGSVNAPGGPTLTTRTLMGSIFVLRKGTDIASAHSLRAARPESLVPPPGGAQLPAGAQTIQQSRVLGLFDYGTSMGNVAIGEVRGDARVFTGAGEIRLGSVTGFCRATSLGGPLNLGEILGPLNARTEAGDVLVRAARQGGTITTGGGIVRLLYMSGPMRIQSGGGDITVHQVASSLYAETQSGDISITVDPTSRTEKVTARTSKGNVILYVPTGFAAEIDATVITSDAEVNRIVSDLAGLSFKREEIGGKTKIHATGKVNGGGDKVLIYAEDGGVTISTRGATPFSVITQ